MNIFSTFYFHLYHHFKNDRKDSHPFKLNCCSSFMKMISEEVKHFSQPRRQQCDRLPSVAGASSDFWKGRKRGRNTSGTRFRTLLLPAVSWLDQAFIHHTAPEERTARRECLFGPLRGCVPLETVCCDTGVPKPPTNLEKIDLNL